MARDEAKQSVQTPAGHRRGQFTARVVANVPLCRDHFRLVLGLDSFPATEPGQFVQIACRDLTGDGFHPPDFQPSDFQRPDFKSPDFQPCEMEWSPGMRPTFSDADLLSPEAMLRRPFSLADRRDLAGGAVELDVIHRIVGVGTGWLSRLAPGDLVGILGPMGNKFDRSHEKTSLLVGGGVGIPPMLYLAKYLAGRPVAAFCGALTRDLLPLTISDAVACDPTGKTATPAIVEFSQYGIPSVIATDDGSVGFRGFVTQALEEYLDHATANARPSTAVASNLSPVSRDSRVSPHSSAGSASSPSAGYVIYTCGPEPMMKRVAEIADRRGIACQVAVERAMACGMGTCQSCVIKVKTAGRADGRTWVYKLACTDGPVFQSADLLW